MLVTDIQEDDLRRPSDEFNIRLPSRDTSPGCSGSLKGDEGGSGRSFFRAGASCRSDAAAISSKLPDLSLLCGLNGGL